MTYKDVKMWVEQQTGSKYNNMQDSLKDFLDFIEKGRKENDKYSDGRHDKFDQALDGIKDEERARVEQNDVYNIKKELKDVNSDVAQKIYEDMRSMRADNDGYSDDSLNQVEGMVAEKLDDSEEVERIEEMIRDLARARQGSEDTVDQIDNKIRNIERAMEDTPGTGATRSKYGKQLADNLSTEITEGANLVYNLKQKRRKLEEGNQNG
jgi:hypothetical protein